MLRHLSLLLLSGLMMLACVRNEKPPENIIQEEKMVDILVDIHLAEAIKQTGEMTLDRTRLEIGDMYSSIFEKHGVTNEQFLESFDWYAKRVEVFDSVYEKVIVRLNSMSPNGSEGAEFNNSDY